ncbi:hypothetical protein [Actinomadura rugatobispora]|uniref:Right handed beta helix domain-containing protein n=1 Tax=Actinomadura rugatobispora TaxID=1994 RepID=A0ABW1A9Y5_9ACTN|nr:hypothetical protein GCM10010200_066920 [Actinomadura rugatobispora]
MALSRTAPVLAAVACLAATACSGAGDDRAGERKSARSPQVPPSATPSAAPTASVPVPPLQLKSPAPVGGEGSRVTWPTLGTVGVPRGKKLRRSGPITVRRNGAVIDGLRVSTEINVEADNVTIRNTQVVGAGQWAIIQRKGRSGLRVENSEINGDGRTKVQYGIVNHGGMITARRVHVHTVSNGINTDHGLVEDSVVDGLKEFPGDHVTAVQSNSGPAPGLSLVVRNNVLLNPVAQTSAVSIYQDFGRAHDVTVVGNLLGGGGYALYGGKGKFGRSSNIRVMRNAFTRRHFKKGGFYGPVTAFERSGRGNVWRDNVWHDTGKPVKP